MMAEINRILQEMGKPDLPLVIAGDFNSLPDSGVYEFLSSGKVRFGWLHSLLVVDLGQAHC